ncbi:MAG TPA: ATP-dependent helicase [Geminicoccaceae bacterium]|nr:ATP-dependent helicase [Geminicoccaceae bacterium]
MNPAQRAAATFGVPETGPAAPGPPLLVIAGAGTGKTGTLAHRVAHLVLNGADPRRILLLTFTRRAAEAMARRAGRICGMALGAESPLELEWAGTFHAIGARLLRLHAQEIGLEPAFTILDRGDAADLVDLVRDELGLARTDRRFPRKATCLAIYSQAVNTQAPLESVLRDDFPWCSEWQAELRRLFAAYVLAKQRQGVLDYDDLLLWWERMLRVPEIAADLGGRFDFVLVDEYQDTNAVQAAILLALKPDGRGVTVVGDDAQAIYAFRGATVRNILDFPDRFRPAARIVRLERNYRSVQPILDAANAVIARAGEGYAKELAAVRDSGRKPVLALVRDDAAQTDWLLGRILERREAGVPLREQAVLFRAAHHSAALEIELARRNIPFVKYGGLRFLEAAHVKDVLAVLRWAENPRDRVAAFRVLQLLPGIGPGTARKALDVLAAAGHRLPAFESFAPPPAAAEHWPRLVQVLLALVRAPWPVQLGLVRRFYDPLLDALHDFPAARRADLAQLEQIAAAAPSRERFLADLTLDPPAAVGREAGVPAKDEDFLILSTIHSAKGQEWRAVHVLNVVDGCIPSDMATGSAAEIDEERRLLYVAMTRAKDELHLIQPERFYTAGQSRLGERYVRAPRTRFITEAMLALFDVRSCAWAVPGAAPRERAPLPTVDIGASLRGMWE